MASRPRSDLYMNLPALKKLDAMLVSIVDGFQDTEFCYVDRGIVVADANDGKVYPSAATRGRPSIRHVEKWLPCPKVPPKGLSEDVRMKLQQCRDCTNQILKAAMAIHSSVLARMDIPNAYFPMAGENVKPAYGGEDEAFLRKVVSPIYDVIAKADVDFFCLLIDGDGVLSSEQGVYIAESVASKNTKQAKGRFRVYDNHEDVDYVNSNNSVRPEPARVGKKESGKSTKKTGNDCIRRGAWDTPQRGGIYLSKSHGHAEESLFDAESPWGDGYS
ncbi:rho guanyl-nucleotide exchange factor 1 [Actinidia rufa]|uniref:Rho guanyl-nucleotide exchange factor 1 n=1 Tax=Actinidia rufa TaxID=165716 RepID=A0A7J0GVH4_9ERIC|nr:rho guanyl-nucleotide exchange factor 1 [Actinidia rufa]